MLSYLKHVLLGKLTRSRAKITLKNRIVNIALWEPIILTILRIFLIKRKSKQHILKVKLVSEDNKRSIGSAAQQVGIPVYSDDLNVRIFHLSRPGQVLLSLSGVLTHTDRAVAVSGLLECNQQSGQYKFAGAGSSLK